MKLFLATILLFMGVAVSASPTSNNKINQGKIHFKISGRDVPIPGWCGTTYTYAQVFLSENSGERIQLGSQTNTVYYSRNPDWSTIIGFNFDRSKNQQLHFDIFGDFGVDGKVAAVTINAIDFVDKVDDEMEVPLSPGGSIRLKRLDVDSGDVDVSDGSIRASGPRPEQVAAKELSAHAIV